MACATPAMLHSGLVHFIQLTLDSGSGFPHRDAFLPIVIRPFEFPFIPMRASLGWGLVHAGISLSASAKTGSGQIIVHRPSGGKALHHGTSGTPEIFLQLDPFEVKKTEKQDPCVDEGCDTIGVPATIPLARQCQCCFSLRGIPLVDVQVA